MQKKLNILVEVANLKVLLPLGLMVFKFLKLPVMKSPFKSQFKMVKERKSGYFLVNKSKYEILDLGTGKAYAFDRNEPWTHIQDISFEDSGYFLVNF